jgi:GntR family transcriptional regulator
VPQPLPNGGLLPPADGRPIYRRLLEHIRGAIESGAYRPGDLIPPELEIARENRISRHTVRQAVVELAREGLLRRERGRGTFVVGRPLVQSLGSFYSFAHEMADRGLPYYTQVLHRRLVEADEAAAERLDVARGAPVVEMELLRVAEEVPLVLDFSLTPYERVPVLLDADVTQRSLYDHMHAAHRVAIALGREQLRPVVLDRRQARLLGVPAGSPAFHVERQVIGALPDGGSAPVEWRRSLVRGDRFLYRVDLPVHPHKPA